MAARRATKVEGGEAPACGTPTPCLGPKPPRSPAKKGRDRVTAVIEGDAYRPGPRIPCLELLGHRSGRAQALLHRSRVPLVVDTAYTSMQDQTGWRRAMAIPPGLRFPLKGLAEVLVVSA